VNTHLLIGQNQVAISIDDAPNTRIFQSDHYQSHFLNTIDSLQIPVTVFINERLIYNRDSINKNFALLNRWVSSKNTIVGNHTFAHSRYSAVGFEKFREDVLKGESIVRELTKKYKKKLEYFRFPYNDLGADSLQHVQMDSLLHSLNYRITPFTIESSDWMFNWVYEYYLGQKQYDKAKHIGELYVSKTIAYFHFYDSLSVEKYNRKVKQIYLCHDNSINRDYFIALVSELKALEYEFISLDEALEDEIYAQKNNYYRKWGISWLYRWMDSQKERVRWMKMEPDMKEIQNLYNNLNQKNKTY
jgi:peptidoglycan/xylan/chitin deacetylase (PgdA/CDA1 family)